MARLEHGAAPEELKTEMAINQTFRRLQREEDQRKGDFSGIGSRYGYVHFVGPSLRATKTIRNQVAKLHGSLGHPSNERLTRMLTINGATKEVVQASKDLRCEICARVHPPASTPKSSSTNPERFNQHVSSDSFFVLDAEGRRWNITHLVDGFCSLQYAVLSKNPSSQVSSDLLFDRWILIHGPMQRLTVDGGPEYCGQFPHLCALYDINLQVLPTSAKWKNGVAERHGSILKLIMLKMIHEMSLSKEPELRYALAMAAQAKNRLSHKCGRSPLQVVQGRDVVLPSSLVEQIDQGEIKFATNSYLMERQEQQKMERMRQEAAAAFHWLDSNERLRMALNSRSRPPHLKADALTPGTVVYFFKQPAQNKRMQDYATAYQGPAIVACSDGPDRLWVRFKGAVVRVALENVRLATEEEEVATSFIKESMAELEAELTGGRRPPGYEDQTEEKDEPEAAPAASLPGPPGEVQIDSGNLAGRAEPQQVEASETPGTEESTVPPPQVPVPTPEVIEMAKASEDRRRMMDGLPPRHRVGPYEPVGKATVPQRIDFFERGGKGDTWRAILEEAGAKLKLADTSPLLRLAAEKDVQHLHRELQAGVEESVRQRDEGGEATLKTQRAEASSSTIVEPGVSTLAPLVAEALMVSEAWALNSTTLLTEGERMKAVLEQFDDDALQMERERGHRAGPEPGARGEIYLKDMTPTEVRLTIPALIKALEIHFTYDAIEPVPVDQLINKDSTLQSRFVIVNKKWLQREFGPKGRRCVGGHLDPHAGEYATSSPTAQLLGHHLLLVITVTLKWTAYGGDITAAFLQGEPLPRDKPLYIWFPRKMPLEVQQYVGQKLKGYREDVVRVVKGVFGLNESPRLWYLGLRKHLQQLGFREMTLAPCVFTLHQKGVLSAMATVHVDDVLLAGGDAAEPIWTELQRRLTFGSWAPMSDGLKFLGRHLKQDTSTFEISTSMADYCADLTEVNIGGSESDDRALTESVVSLLRSINGKLSWAARQSRPDVLFLVSLLQQSMKAPQVRHLRMANQVIRQLKKNVTLNFVQLGCSLDELLFVVATDGAYGTMPEGKSQQGWLVAIAHPNIKEGHSRMNLVEWQSSSCKRIVRSSMAIEASAASMGYEHGEYVRALFGEIICEDFQVRKWGHFVRRWELLLVLDARTAHDTLQTESLPQDRRTALDLLAIKESLLDESNRSLCRWVPGPQQISDGLTKEKDNKMLLSFLENNKWSLKEDTTWQEQRERQRAHQKAYKANAKAARKGASGGELNCTHVRSIRISLLCHLSRPSKLQGMPAKRPLTFCHFKCFSISESRRVGMHLQVDPLWLHGLV